jgi:hypothetical protein
MQKKVEPLETRPFKIRNPKLEFICPLCRTQRGFAFSHKISRKSALKVFFISLFTIPFLGIWAMALFFGLVSLLELGLRLLHKCEVPCPYCGFDASWYKRDLNTAREKIKSFWKDKKNFGHKAR